MLKYQEIEQMSDLATISWNVFYKLVHATHTIPNIFHLFGKLMPNRLALEDAVNNPIGCRLLTLKVRLNLLGVVTMPKRINVFQDLLSLDSCPELATSHNLCLHLEHLVARSVVAAHEVLECIDAQDESQIFQQMQNRPIPVVLCLLEINLPEAILSFTHRLNLVHFKAISVVVELVLATWLLLLGLVSLIIHSICWQVDISLIFLLLVFHRLGYISLHCVLQIGDSRLERFVEHVRSLDHLLNLIIKIHVVGLKLIQPALLLLFFGCCLMPISADDFSSMRHIEE